jgi:hypothetical protein
MTFGFYARSTWMTFKVHRVAEAEAASHPRDAGTNGPPLQSAPAALMPEAARVSIARSAGRSRSSTMEPGRSAAMARASVVFPSWRGPTRTTPGKTARRWRMVAVRER